MRVLHVYKSYYPDSFGGIEQAIFQLANGLQKLGVENRVLTLSPSAKPMIVQRPEAQVVRFQTTFEVASNPVSLGALANFREQVLWADVVHYQFPWPFADVLHLWGAKRKPSVLSYQSDIVRQKYLYQIYRPLMRRFLGAMDAVVATSPNYLATSEVLRGLHTPIDVIPNGIDEATVPPLDHKLLTKWREQVGVGFSLFVGVLRYYKGLDVLLRAAVHLSHPVVIAGAGPEMAALVAQSKALGLRHVHFVGEVSEVDKVALYTLARLCVFPSNLRSEAFGMTLVEAAMYSKPMVSCEIGTGTTFVNLHSVTGLAVAPDDPQALAQAMQRISLDPALAAKMGTGARARYEALFTGDQMASAYHSVYKRLLTAST